MPVVVATMIPRPDQMDAVVAILEELIPVVHQEDGCERYALHRGRDRLVFVEHWRDMDARAAHGSGPSIKAMNERLAGLLAGRPDVQVLEAVPAGDPGKGRV